MLLIPFNPISTALWAEDNWILKVFHQLAMNIILLHYLTLITPSWSSWKLLLWATNWPLVPVPYLKTFIIHKKIVSFRAHLQCSVGLQASWIIGGLTFHCTSTELWDKETNKTPVMITVLNCDMVNCSPWSVAWRLGEESVTTWEAIGHTVISTWNLEMLKLSRRQSGQSNILQVVKTLGMMSWEDNNPLYWAGLGQDS